MADIFIPWKMGNLDIPNRLVRSATWEGLAEDDGTPKIELANLSAELAEGGVGLLISGYMYVQPEGLGLPHQTGIFMDAHVGPLTRVSDAVHKAGGVIAAQIVHAGGQTKTDWTRQEALYGPSAITHPAFGGQVHEMSKEHIAGTVQAFADGAARAKAAGFDAVQLHGAHGYLINQFLSPNTNLRTDEYGGDINGRARFCLEVYEAARQAVGPDYPLFIKLNTTDALEGGLEFADALEVAKMLDARGIDAIEVSGGVPAARKNSPSRMVKEPSDEGYFLDNAKAVKDAVKCPVIVVGGWRSKPRIQDALDIVDAVAMSRPLVRQPNLPQLWAEGGNEPAACISCGKCFGTAMSGHLACAVEAQK